MLNPEEDETKTASDELTSCSLCGRNFLTERLNKHLQICQKLKEKKRKQFDSVKQRAENLDKINLVPTELNIVVEKPPTVRAAKKKVTAAKGSDSTAVSEPEQKSTKPKPSWKAKHEEFLRTIRMARGEDMSKFESEVDQSGDEVRSDGKSSVPPGMVECPCCGRRFSDRAGDRHIAWCTQKQQNDQLKRDSLTNQEALERMKARTKYKPPTLNGSNSTNPPSTATSTNSNRSSRSNPKQSTSNHLKVESVSRSRANSTSRSSPKANSPNSSTAINRKYTRNISKSSESLVTTKAKNRGKATVAAPVIKRPMATTTTTPTASRASTRTDTTPSSENGHSGRMARDSASNRTIVVRKSGGAATNAKGVAAGAKYSTTATAKVNTGLTSPKKDVRQKNSAPVMKFKEKFPNHQQRINSTPFDFEILRRNSSAYDDSPKTVPGVRTGGISPVKNVDKRSLLSRSEVNLHKVGGDIKKRIDMYINGLYDNDLVNHYTTNINRFVDEHFKGKNPQNLTEEEVEALRREVSSARAEHMSTNMKRPHSINSELSAARGSTSDSTDSGLGVYSNAVMAPDGKKLSNASTTTTYPVADIVSPPMSDLERRSRMTLRNGSLNDIHLMNGVGGRGQHEMVLSDSSDDQPSALDTTSVHDHPYYDEVDVLSSDPTTARFCTWCHNCGTKYPNTLAKFCYECGNRRFTVVS